MKTFLAAFYMSIDCIDSIGKYYWFLRIRMSYMKYKKLTHTVLYKKYRTVLPPWLCCI